MGFGRNINSTVSDIQVFKRSVPQAMAGENVGVLLRSVRPDIVERYVDYYISQTSTLYFYFVVCHISYEYNT